MLIALLIGVVMSAILVIGVGLLGLIGFVAEAPKEFPQEFGTEATPPPTHPIVTELSRHTVPGLQGKEGRVLSVEFPGGVHVGPHRHPGAIFAHVVQGTVTSHAESSPPQQHKTGDTWFEAPMELYAYVDNQGWETAKVLVFDLTDAGESVQFFEPPGNGATTYPNPRAGSELTLIATQHDMGGSR